MFRIVFAIAALAALIASPAGATPFLLAGVEVSGYTSQCTVGAPYVSCAEDETVSSSSPGTGQFLATTDGSLGTGYYGATGWFSGYLDPPTAEVSAEAGSEPAPEPGFYYWTDSAASARVIQGYTYRGSVPATFEAQVGLLAGIEGGPLNQVFANVSIFDAATYDPDAEIFPIITYVGLSANGIGDDLTNSVDYTAPLSFELQPGQGVYMIVDLEAISVSRYAGYQTVGVDASHTLTVNFTNGPLDLLTPALTAPEPGTSLVLGAGCWV